MFLAKVYRSWRLLFWLLTAFIAAQVFFMFKGIENAPFFIYSMFATVHPPKDSLPVYLIKTGDGYYEHFRQSNRAAELITNNIDLYNRLHANGYREDILKTIHSRMDGRFAPATIRWVEQQLVNDSLRVNRYPEWYCRYFSQIVPEFHGQLQVVKSYVSFQGGFRKSPIDSVIFTACTHP